MPRAKKTGKPGRPSWMPTDKDRNIVETMTACGITPVDIGKVFGVSEKTVRRKFRDELNVGHIKANAKVAKSLFDQAIGGNVTAQIFWAKARMGWRDVNRAELVGDNGGPIQIETARELLAAKFEALGVKDDADSNQGGAGAPT